MTREEAVALLERYSNYDGMGIPNLAGCKEAMKVAVESLKEAFPELRESEDERIRNEIIDHLVKEVGLYPGEDRKEHRWLRWLEKQKEYVSEKFDDVWALESCEELIAEGKKLSPRFKELLKDVCHAWYDKGIELGKKQKEPHYTKRNALFDKCVAECDPEIMQRVSDEIDEMLEKEQKPNSTEDMYIADEHFYERTPADSFKYKLAEYMTKNHRKAEGPYGHTYLISAETILKMAGEELLKRGVVQKPAEWSEEDEYRREGVVEWLRDHQKTIDRNSNNQAYESIESLISWLKSLSPQLSDEEIKKIRSEEYTKGFNDAAFGGQLKEWGAEDEDRIRQIERIAQQAGCTQKLQEEIHDWLKSLRSSWKPSEVCYGEKGDPDPAGVWIPSEKQMEALNALNCHGVLSYVGQQNQLISLQKDLEKLKGIDE